MIRDDAKWDYEQHGYVLTCLQCGVEFIARRSDAKFHSPVCRKANARRKDQIQRAATVAIDQIKYIRRMVSEYPDLEIAAALELDRIDRALSVTTAGKTDSAIAVNVSIAVETDKKICPKCGREVDYISIFTDSCETCIRENGKLAS